MSKMLKIGGATVNQTPIDWKNNRQNILDAILEARSEKVDILCFPELAITGYGCEDLFLSEWLNKKAWEELLAIAQACINISVCIGLPIRMNSITYNGVCVIQHQKILGITLKQNLAKDGVHYETRWFEEWKPESVQEIHKDNLVVRVGDLIYEHEGVTFAFEICEDAWRSIRPGENHCKKGVDIILNPSASHFALLKSTTREKLVIESSNKFNCTYVYVNLLGNEAGRMIYDGDILVAQRGHLILRNNRLSFQKFNLQLVDLDIDAAVPNSHIDYEEIDKREEFTQSVSLALYNYLLKSKAKGFVLSLSGGADSACCAVLVAEMVRRCVSEIGVEGFAKSLMLKGNQPHDFVHQLLTCAYQATINSSTITHIAAETLAKSLNAKYYYWQINDEISSYTQKIENLINRKLNWKEDDATLQNIQARSRSPIIWMLANIYKSILLTTSNRSEGDVGYATMDGDTSGSLAPILGVDKTFVREWLQWAETSLGYKGLRAINQLSPSAELRPNEKLQTDEEDLMPYSLLVEIEKLAIRDRKSPAEVFDYLRANHNPSELKENINKFFRMWASSQWKRERMAPSFHLDEISIDPKSWCRFPILSGNFEEDLLP